MRISTTCTNQKQLCTEFIALSEISMSSKYVGDNQQCLAIEIAATSLVSYKRRELAVEQVEKDNHRRDLERRSHDCRGGTPWPPHLRNHIFCARLGRPRSASPTNTSANICARLTRPVESLESTLLKRE